MNKYIIVAGLAIVLVLGVLFPRPIVRVGSVVSNDILDSFFSVSKVKTDYYHMSFAPATSTACSVKSPAATSTVTFAASLFTGTSTALQFQLGSSATDNTATTTNLGGIVTFAVNVNQDYIMASSTAVAPNTYVNFNMVGGAGNKLLTANGGCSYRFNEIY